MYINNTPLKPYQLYLSSNNYTSKLDDFENYFYELNYPIIKNSNIDIIVKLESFIFLNGMYNINSTNNNFYYSFVYNGVINRVVIPIGNYNIDELLSYLNITLLNKLSFTFNSKTLKITIQSTNPEYDSFRLVNNNFQNLIYKMLGFNENQNIDVNLYQSKTSDFIINLNSNVSLNILLNNLKLQTNNVKNYKNYSILSNIPLSSSFGEIQTYISTSNFYYIIDQDIISSINFQILNQDFQNVNFNNIPWYCSITFDFIYKTQLIIPDDFFSNQNNNNQNVDIRDELLDREKDKIINN